MGLLSYYKLQKELPNHSKVVTFEGGEKKQHEKNIAWSYHSKT